MVTPEGQAQEDTTLSKLRHTLSTSLMTAQDKGAYSSYIQTEGDIPRPQSAGSQSPPGLTRLSQPPYPRHYSPYNTPNQLRGLDGVVSISQISPNIFGVIGSSAISATPA
ncbi:unnamed protein product [Nezara viridula]|uniref:Uncharacterized protein n=1 Tax=Nezara viridula TaxID=85310 RepID=A0A9P0MPZ9_NEZVI|nr:unnamed protein product [Nezara viridula]